MASARAVQPAEPPTSPRKQPPPPQQGSSHSPLPSTSASRSSPLADVVASSPERDGGPTSPPHGLIASSSHSRSNLQQTMAEADSVVVPVSPGALGRHDDVGMQAVSAVQSVCSCGDIGGGGGSVDSVAASEACQAEEAQASVVDGGSDANTTVPVAVVVSDAQGAPPAVTRPAPADRLCEEILEESGGSACHVFSGHRPALTETSFAHGGGVGCSDCLKVEGDESADFSHASPRGTHTAPVSPLDGDDPHLSAWSATGDAGTSLDHDSDVGKNPVSSDASFNSVVPQGHDYLPMPRESKSSTCIVQVTLGESVITLAIKRRSRVRVSSVDVGDDDTSEDERGMMEDPCSEVSTRSGPAPLHICQSKLRRAGQYRLSYGDMASAQPTSATGWGVPIPGASWNKDCGAVQPTTHALPEKAKERGVDAEVSSLPVSRSQAKNLRKRMNKQKKKAAARKEAAASTAAAAAPTALAGSQTNRGRSSSPEPRWGNCSTKISFEERKRRSQVLKEVRLPASYNAGAKVKNQPTPFPEESRLPGGGFYIPEGPNDELPPPSAYEVEVAAMMMKVYHDMMAKLKESGNDTPLPNGHTPKIYDLTP